MITYRRGFELDYIRLIELLIEAGWEEEKTNDFQGLIHMVEGADVIITAWDFDYMVGFASLFNNINKNAIDLVLVDKDYQNKGLKEELEERVKV